MGFDVIPYTLVIQKWKKKKQKKKPFTWIKQLVGILSKHVTWNCVFFPLAGRQAQGLVGENGAQGILRSRMERENFKGHSQTVWPDDGWVSAAPKQMTAATLKRQVAVATTTWVSFTFLHMRRCKKKKKKERNRWNGVRNIGQKTRRVYRIAAFMLFRGPLE